MASPFSVFRKNQKGLMVALVGLSMFAFIILGSGDPYAEGSGLAFVLMVVCAVAALAWGFGVRKGKGVEWASAGAVAALIVVGVFWYFSRPPAYVQTNAGGLEVEDVQSLVDQRQIANDFLQRAYATAVPMPRELEDFPKLEGLDNQFLEQLKQRQLAMQQQAWQQGIEPYLFDYGTGFARDPLAVEQDVVFGYVLSKEADRLGIQISDRAVNDFIQQVTDDPRTPEVVEGLSKADIRRILDGMRVGPTRLMDALRAEIRNRQAYQLLQPVTYTTPQEYWDIYRQLSVKQRLEATAVPVEAFVDDKAEPSQAELVAMFESFQRRQPNAEKPGDPGFVQPYRTRAAYLVVDRESIEKQVSEPTEEQIAAHYEKNKDLYRNRTVPLTPHPDHPGYYRPDLGGDSAFEDDPFPSLEGPDTTAPPADDAPDTPGTPAPQDGDEKPPADPADEKPADTPADEKSSDETPADEKPSDPKPAEDEPDEPAGTPKSPEAPANDEPSPPADEVPGESPDDESSSISSAGDLLLSVSDDEAPSAESAEEADDAPTPAEKADEVPAEKTPEDNAPAERPQPEKPAADAPDDDPSKPAEPAEPEPADPAKPAAETKPESETEEPAEQPASEQTPAEPGPETPEKVEPPQPEFKPLDEVRDEIRRTLVSQRAQEKIDALVTAAIDFASELGAEYGRRTLDTENPLVMKDVHDRMLAYAREHGMDYVTTPLLSQVDLAESPDYPLVDVQVESEGLGRGESVLPRLFDNSDSLLLPIRGSSPFGNAEYVVWKTADVPMHVPMLETKTAPADARLVDVATELGYEERDVDRLFARRGESETLGSWFAAHFDGPVEKGRALGVQQYRLVASEVAGGKVTRLQLHEPGIREQVVRAWRLAQARPKAEERAEALAKLAREKKGTELGLVFAEETVTGDEKGQALEVRETNEFSWLTRSSVPSGGFEQPGVPRLSTIAGIDRAGPQFMEKVFRDLDNGEIGVVPNFDVDRYYVVKVKERSPLAPLESPTHKTEFLSVVRDEADPNSRLATYAILASGENRVVDSRWANALFERYEVEFNR